MSDHPLLKVDISQLSIAERIQLAEDLWDSILTQQAEPPLTNAQKQELVCFAVPQRGNRRLQRYQQDPMAGSTWEEIKQRLGFSE